VLPAENPMPAYACAPGKAILAFASPEKRELALQGPLTPYTEATLTSLEQLENEFAEIREKGYALNRQEYLNDTVGIAVPIFDASGAVVAAVSSSGSTPAWNSDRLQELVPMLRSISDSVSAALGFSHTANIVG
jgi:DNA-binding IclR family transcriptional regulator